MRTLLTTAIAALLLTGGLTSCANDEPPMMPPETAVSEPISEPPQEQEAPKAFVARWITALENVSQTGGTAEFERLSKDCVPCDDYVARVTDRIESGGTRSGGGITVEKMKLSKCGPKRQTCVLVDVTFAPGSATAADGTVTRFTGGPSILDVTLTAVDDEWRVAYYVIAPRSDRAPSDARSKTTPLSARRTTLGSDSCAHC